MAGPTAAVAEAWDKVTVFLYSQLYDERKRAENNVSALIFCVSHFALGMANFFFGEMSR